MPWIAATTLHQYRGGDGSRSAGTSQPATTKAYRAAPMASTQPPTDRASSS